MNTKQQFIGIAIASLTAASASAQFDVQLPLQYGWQQTVANPAALQDHKFTIGLPSVGAGFFTPIAVNDMGHVDNGTLYIDPDQFINRLNDRGNDQRFALNAETVAFNYRHRGWQVGLSHAVRTSGSIDLPKGLVQLAAYGNARFVGQELQVMPIINATAYQEFAVNGAYTLWDKFTVGARLKFLKGSAALQTTTAEARIFTDPDFYASTVATNITVSTAGFPVTFTDEGVDFGDLNGYASAGTGMGADFGLVYRQEDKFEVGLSIRDMGGISWTGDAKQHRSNGSFNFSGYQENIFEGEEVAFDVAGTIDSVLAEVQFESTNATFRTTLPTTVQGTFRYAVADHTTLNATVYAAQAGGWHSGFGLGIGQRVGEWLHLGALAGMKREGGYLATNVLFDIYGAQLYLAVDNVLALANVQDANAAYVRAGLNLAFVKVKPGKAVKGWYDVKVEGINR